MKKLVLAVCLFLGGCATMGKPQTLQDWITEARQVTSAACDFVPTAAVIASLINAGYTTYTDIAQAICASLYNVRRVEGQKRQTRGTPIVRGVPIHGQFRDGRRI